MIVSFVNILYLKKLAKIRKIDIIVYVNKKEVLMNKEELVKEVSKKAKVSQKAAADVYVLSAAVFNRIIRHADCTLIVT